MLYTTGMRVRAIDMNIHTYIQYMHADAPVGHAWYVVLAPPHGVRLYFFRCSRRFFLEGSRSAELDSGVPECTVGFWVVFSYRMAIFEGASS